MEEILKEVKTYDTETLRGKLKGLGVPVGPITPSTKQLFQKRLAKKLFEATGAAVSNEETQIAAENAPSSNDACDHASHATASDVFYGICLPEPIEDLDENGVKQLVFTDRELAMKTAKKFKGSRFKVFKSESDAERFSQSSVDTSFQSPFKLSQEADKPAVSFESSPFKAPKIQDIVQLRLAIERGETDTFKECVWTNPRFLVSSGDTPVIYQESTRYTAMHVAAWKNRPTVCRMILDILADPEFVNRLYSESKNTEETQKQRMTFLVDLYLNMPDKGNCESPLHFACKFGHEDVVEVLVSHAMTDRQLKNRYGETPSDVICTRCQNVTEAKRARIGELLQGQCYVPLIRSDDNTTVPVVGDPWSPDVSETLFDNISKVHWSPRDPALSVRACAGPMSPSSAGMFRKRWTTPPSHSPEQTKKYLDTKRSDSEKGLERIGRQIAHELHIPWQEYWDFLGTYADLGTPTGLTLLESFFKKHLFGMFIKQLRETRFAMDVADISTPAKANGTNRDRSQGDDINQNQVLKKCSFGEDEPNEPVNDSKMDKLGKDTKRNCSTDEDKTCHSDEQGQEQPAVSLEGGVRDSVGNDVSPMTSLVQTFSKLSVIDTSYTESPTKGADTASCSNNPSADSEGESSANNVRNGNICTETEMQLARSVDLPELSDLDRNQKTSEKSSDSSYASLQRMDSLLSDASYKTAEEDLTDLDTVFHSDATLLLTIDCPEVREFCQSFCPPPDESDLESQEVSLLVHLKSCNTGCRLTVDVVTLPVGDDAADMKVMENIEAEYTGANLSVVEEGAVVDVSVCRQEPSQEENYRLRAYFYRTVSLQTTCFIHGSQPTREDLDVSRALTEVTIPLDQFPNVCNWRLKMSEFLEDSSYRWQSPAKVKSRFLQASPNPLSRLKSSPGIPFGSPLGITGRHVPRSNGNLPTIRTNLFPAIAE